MQLARLEGFRFGLSVCTPPDVAREGSKWVLCGLNPTRQDANRTRHGAIRTRHDAIRTASGGGCEFS